MTTLAELKETSKRHVDVIAEATRQCVISPGAGQVATYQEKAEQAIDFASAGYPINELSNYPFIEAEVEALGKTAQEVADGILAARSLWIGVAANIEKIRLGAKKNIDDAVDASAVHAAVSSATQLFHTIITQ
jgi:hypothetical protein